MTWAVVEGDAKERLTEMEPASVQCCVTSPPYFGLRDYGTATWEGGDEGCEHIAGPAVSPSSTLGGGKQPGVVMPLRGPVCHCGARRIDQQLGLEPTPDAYVAALVDVFREVRRVLADDGTVWLNLGDSYCNTGGMTGGTASKDGGAARVGRMFKGAYRPTPEGMKPKDLLGIPWMVAFALRSDGWYLRSDIIWAKPNPMPESVTDRPTKAHEYLFLLSKRARYFYDAAAVREGTTRGYDKPGGGSQRHLVHGNGHSGLDTFAVVDAARNLRDVWTVATEPFPEAHFATFPKALVEPCIKAGTSEKGVCPECRRPWVRVVERDVAYGSGSGRAGNVPNGKYADTEQALSGEYDIRMGPMVSSRTTSWKPTCSHDAEPIPATVLDPFAGSGTTGVVALRLGRAFHGIELNPVYAEMARNRIRNDAPLWNPAGEQSHTQGVRG